MSDKAYRVDYYKAVISNRPGEGAKILGALKKEGINLLGFTGFPRKSKSQIDFIPQNSKAFTAAAKRIGLRVTKKETGFLVQGQDKVGAIANIMEKLGKAKINITAIDALCAGKGRFGTIFWVKKPNVNKAAKILKASKK